MLIYQIVLWMFCMQVALTAAIYQGETKHPYEKAGFLRCATHFFNFGQDAYQIEYFDGKSTLALKSSTDHKPSWIGIALRVAALFTVIIPLVALAATLIYRTLNRFEPVGSISPDLPRDIHVITAKYMNTEDLLKMRLVSKDLKAVAEMELIERLNRGAISPGDLQIDSLPSLIDYFGDQAQLITRIRYQDVRQQFDVALLRRFPRLKELDLNRFTDDINLSFLEDCADLTYLYPTDCDQINDLSFLEHCPKLIQLNLSECRQITDLSFLRYCPKLIQLNLSGCKQITDLSFLEHCPKLIQLNLSGCRQINDLRFLEHCSDLTHLDLGFSNLNNDLSFLEHCPHLTHLYLNGCNQITDLSFLRYRPDLTHLSLRFCVHITDFSFLEHCLHLTHLDLSSGYQSTDLSFLEHCPHLTHLDLSWCGQINDLSFLEHCPDLTHLYLNGCRQITDLSFLERCPNLKSYIDPSGVLVQIR